MQYIYIERTNLYNVRKIRDIFYCDWNRQIYLRHVFKTQTKVSLAIDFFIFTKRKSTSSMMHFLQSYAFQDT
mgnify:CR=1 FL=1